MFFSASGLAKVYSPTERYFVEKLKGTEDLRSFKNEAMSYVNSEEMDGSQLTMTDSYFLKISHLEHEKAHHIHGFISWGLQQKFINELEEKCLEHIKERMALNTHEQSAVMHN